MQSDQLRDIASLFLSASKENYTSSFIKRLCIIKNIFIKKTPKGYLLKKTTTKYPFFLSSDLPWIALVLISNHCQRYTVKKKIKSNLILVFSLFVLVEMKNEKIKSK